MSERNLYRLHWLTWTGMVVVIGCWLFRNLAGGPDQFSSAVSEFGWPWTFLTCLNLDWNPDEPASWTPMNIPVQSLSLVALVGNLATGAVVFLGTVIAIERWIRCQEMPPKLSVKVLLVVTAWIATGIAIFQDSSLFWRATTVAGMMLYLSVGLCWYAVFDVIPRLLGWAREQ